MLRTVAAVCLLAVMPAAQNRAQVPTFAVDAQWPKPLPNQWILGAVAGVAVDASDHVWIVHRPSTLQPNETRSIWRAAPPVLEFDVNGELLSAWGGPGEGYEWPDLEHGIFVDQDAVWLGGGGEKDAQLLKFTRGGKFLLQIGRKGKNGGSNDPAHVGGAVQHENRPSDYDPTGPPAPQFRIVHAVRIAHDGLVYVCDRTNDRIQVFRKDGTFVKEAFIAKNTLGSGSVWHIAFSNDPAQTYLIVNDGTNQQIWTLRRDSLEILSAFGHAGHAAGASPEPMSWPPIQKAICSSVKRTKANECNNSRIADLAPHRRL